MLIVCPSCTTSYDVDVASLRPNGRQVRCVRCRTVWHAELPDAEKVIAAAEAVGPVRRTMEAVAEIVAEEAKDASPPAVISKGDWYEPPAGSEDRPARSGPALDDDWAPQIEAPPIAPTDIAEDESAADSESGRGRFGGRFEKIGALGGGRSPRKGDPERRRWPFSALQSGIAALIIVDALIVVARAEIVRVLPQTASFYARIGLPVNLRGLYFDGVTTSAEQSDNVPILLVQGNIVNQTSHPASVPRLKVVLRNAAHQEIYSWTVVPSNPTLPSYEALPFRTRLASPPAEAHDVLVRFVNRYDIVAGGR